MAYHRPRPSVDGLNAVSLVWRAGTMQCHLCGVQAQDDTPCSELCGKQRLPAQQKRWERCNPAQKQWNPAHNLHRGSVTHPASRGSWMAVCQVRAVHCAPVEYSSSSRPAGIDSTASSSPSLLFSSLCLSLAFPVFSLPLSSHSGHGSKPLELAADNARG